jgi:hypothetical protein
MRRTAVAILLLVGTACSRGERGADPDKGGPSTTGPTGDQCAETDDCEDGHSCVAPYTGQGSPGDFACVEGCVGEEDAERWCADTQACCEGLTCDIVGYCKGPSEETDGSGTTGTSDGGTTDASGAGTDETGGSTDGTDGTTDGTSGTDTTG